jgi:putative copper export protein
VGLELAPVEVSWLVLTKTGQTWIVPLTVAKFMLDVILTPPVTNRTPENNCLRVSKLGRTMSTFNIPEPGPKAFKLEETPV